jgi:hypothetical protein
MPVFDAGFYIKEPWPDRQDRLQAAGLSRYLVRLAINATARRNVLPPYRGHGRRPEYGEVVRPLARQRKGKTLPATPPDRVETWMEGEVTLRAEFWPVL